MLTTKHSGRHSGNMQLRHITKPYNTKHLNVSKTAKHVLPLSSHHTHTLQRFGSRIPAKLRFRPPGWFCVAGSQQVGCGPKRPFCGNNCHIQQLKMSRRAQRAADVGLPWPRPHAAAKRGAVSRRIRYLNALEDEGRVSARLPPTNGRLQLFLQSGQRTTLS